MEAYIQWKREDGLPLDPWLRVPVRCNAFIVKVCNRAVKIRGTVAQWEKWTKMALPQAREYVVEGALNPNDSYLSKGTNRLYYTITTTEITRDNHYGRN